MLSTTTTNVNEAYQGLAEREKPCPGCLSEDDIKDAIKDGDAFHDLLGDGYYSKGDMREGTLELYGCTSCGGSGGGLEPCQDEPNYVIGKSFMDRLGLVGVKEGTGRVPVLPQLRRECNDPHRTGIIKGVLQFQSHEQAGCKGWVVDPNPMALAQALADADMHPAIVFHIKSREWEVQLGIVSPEQPLLFYGQNRDLEQALLAASIALMEAQDG